jgi:hypothetical protein
VDADSARDQSNLNMACLRSAVKLLDNLELKALDGAIGDDSVHVVSRLYIRYSGILLKSLDCCKLGLSVSSIHSQVEYWLTGRYRRLIVFPMYHRFRK